MISGKKTVEFRLLNEKSNSIKVGDIIKFLVVDDENKYLLVRVIDKFIYDDLASVCESDEYLNNNLDCSKEEFVPIAKEYYMFGYDLYATEGTYKFLKEHDVPVHFVNRICEKTNTIFDLMFTDTVDLVIDIPTRNDNLKDGFLIRRFAVEAGIPIYTSLDTAKALIDSLEKRKQGVPSLIDITKLR